MQVPPGMGGWGHGTSLGDLWHPQGAQAGSAGVRSAEKVLCRGHAGWCEVSRRAPACAPCSRLASSRGCVPVSARLCTYVFCSGHPPCMCFVRVLHDSVCVCAYHVLMCVSCTRECVSTHLGICLSGLLVPTFVQVCTCVHV